MHIHIDYTLRTLVKYVNTYVPTGQTHRGFLDVIFVVCINTYKKY